VIDASKPLPPLPAEWKEVALEDGRHYYYNTRTKETTWDRPTGDDSTAEEKLPENWVERTDDRTGAKFYFNVVTHVKADERPRATDRVPIQSKRARDNIFTPSAPTGDWKMPPKQPKSAAARAAIVRALKKGFLFSALVESDLNDLVDTMTEVRVASGQKLITQGALCKLAHREPVAGSCLTDVAVNAPSQARMATCFMWWTRAPLTSSWTMWARWLGVDQATPSARWRCCMAAHARRRCRRSSRPWCGHWTV